MFCKFILAPAAPPPPIKSWVRPCVYGASNAIVSNGIERILKYFTRKLWIRSRNFDNIPHYPTRPLTFSLVPIQRIRSDLMLVFGIANDLTNVLSLSVQFSKLNNRRLIVHRVNSKLSQRVFTHRNRTIMIWNKLICNSSFQIQNINLFKHSLYKSDLLPFTEWCALKVVQALRTSPLHIISSF